MHKMVCALIAFIALTVLPPVFVFAEAQKGNITFTLKNAGPVVFSHDYHTRTRGVKCAACHFGLFQHQATAF